MLCACDFCLARIAVYACYNLNKKFKVQVNIGSLRGGLILSMLESADLLLSQYSHSPSGKKETILHFLRWSQT
jgi:hypothetical protein